MISLGTAATHNNSIDNCALLFNKYYSCQSVSLFVILTPFGCLFVHQEAHMEVINPFIRDNQQRMVMFLDELSVRLKKNFLLYSISSSKYLYDNLDLFKTIGVRTTAAF